MKNYILMIIAAIVIVFSLVIGSHNGDLSGADGKAEEMITEVAPDYEPYFNSIFEPSGETESLLFALQASIGAFVIGYILGRKKNDKGSNIVFEKQQS
ncbi:Cobalt transport protein CbiN [Caloramator mitchellensis]|uniref:Cobalt transport protein CbiN n=1 Tax=Caloramator mitchellensis TaxID=908809 RepID=A0A0R3JR41_CALMK|nr:energy-coupling factor ABC transporter substrate-binding protein [Caloramator mitchellensis]KRQ85927.1 Cobalt transport protein CbiN [Caloramator mitchellensis]